MKEVEIGDFAAFQDSILSKIDKIAVYRGVRSIHYDLLPKVWRVNKSRGKAKRLDKERKSFETFVKNGRSLLDRDPIDDWDWLAIAQHHGVSTRLLDWSHNPLVAAYFAVKDRDHKDDSCIYSYLCERGGKDIVSYEDFPDPFTVPEIFRVIPRHSTKRIVAQAGLFTIHPDPDVTLASDRIEKLIIKRSFRKELRNMVWKFGITPFALFPDLDGLSELVNQLNDRS